ncbi:MAG TPA: hypothetical protein VFQ60_02295 [Patescibacteria group bacterium]|nr:hypothetical protein [Patescibacteria group bacterium]
MELLEEIRDRLKQNGGVYVLSAEERIKRKRRMRKILLTAIALRIVTAVVVSTMLAWRKKRETVSPRLSEMP